MPARRMSAREARANFGDLLGMVFYTREPVIIEKKGRPFAVVISPEQYESMQKERERAWTVVDRVRERNIDKEPEEVLRDVTAEVEAVRQEMYEAEKRPSKRRR